MDTINIKTIISNFSYIMATIIIKQNSPQHLFLIVEIIIIYKNSNWYLFNYKNQWFYNNVLFIIFFLNYVSNILFKKILFCSIMGTSQLNITVTSFNNGFRVQRNLKIDARWFTEAVNNFLFPRHEFHNKLSETMLI